MTSEAATSSNNARWPIALIVAIAFAAMARSIGSDWSSYDDDLFLFRNPHFDPPTVSSLSYYWTHGFRGLWTPVTQSVWWLVANVSQIETFEPGAIRLNPWTFHALNVAIHCVTSALAFVLIHRIVPKTWPALVGAALFAAHPVQVEAVAWACGTKDLLAAMFMLATLALATSSRATWLHIVAAIFTAALAMLSKPSAVVLPAMLVVYSIMKSANESRTVPGPVRGGGAPALKRLAIVAASLVLAIPTIVIARHVQVVGDVPAVSLIARPLVAFDAIANHLAHLVAPTRLCADYGLTPSELLSSSRRWWTWAVPLLLTTFAIRSFNAAIIGGSCLFVVALAPNLGLAPFQFQVYSTVADRYAYPAMLGAGLVAAGLVALLQDNFQFDAQRRRDGIIVASVMIIGFSLASIRQCGIWANARTLWTHTLTINDESSLAHNNLGATLMASGDLEGALHHLEASRRAGAANDFALLNLAQLHIRQGDVKDAADAVVELVESFRRRSDHDPDLEGKTIEHFAAAIGAIDPAAADAMRKRLER